MAEDERSRRSAAASPIAPSRRPMWRAPPAAWSASSSSESSIAPPSSSSEGRWRGRGSRQASISSVSSRGRSGRRRRSGRARRPIERAVATRVAAPVRVLAAPALVQGEGERVDVGLGARLEALGLLRGHVGERADHVAGLGQARRVGDQGDAEVHQLGPRLPVDDLDVLRLDVAVDDAARVGVVERFAEVGADLADLAVGEDVLGGRRASVSPSTSSETSSALPSSSPIS